MSLEYDLQIKKWIKNDPLRMAALSSAASLNLPDWCLAAGFVRNLAWDRMHGYALPTPLNDIDLIYFDASNANASCDGEIEARLKAETGLPWSVKNQARMHKRNLDCPYTSTENAMSYWVEVETAVGVYLDHEGNIQLLAPFGVTSLFGYTITLNSKRPKRAEYLSRIKTKKWLETWPQLKTVS